ncbi:hypothetical protein [Nocardioides sp. TF02-7]|uniref:hypothetical protein n=1 Tax=Nocardioides sp. TF02-7 TaxID=2917724 RepID=UPI001F05AF9F|nr:hypothetical protein [Nocardioides sp. TF02-7]UMG94990.1 hypothetical protein MF408_24010 [Nocardioides sp. TF02-7]
MPSQKFGIAIPAVAAVVRSRSSRPPGRWAAPTPVGDTDDDGDEQRQDRQDQGDRQTVEHELGHGLAGSVGRAEVARDDAGHPVQVLRCHRSVEPEVGTDARQLLVAGVLARDCDGRVAGDEVLEQEGDEGRDDQGGNRPRQARSHGLERLHRITADRSSPG